MIYSVSLYVAILRAFLESRRLIQKRSVSHSDPMEHGSKGTSMQLIGWSSKPAVQWHFLLRGFPTNRADPSFGFWIFALPARSAVQTYPWS